VLALAAALLFEVDASEADICCDDLFPWTTVVQPAKASVNTTTATTAKIFFIRPSFDCVYAPDAVFYTVLTLAISAIEDE
jgi:hypothetical protein